MALTQLLRQFVHHLKTEGVRETAAAVTGRIRRSAATTLEGTPGYFAGRQYWLRRRYNIETITPIWVAPDAITGLTGEYERRDDGHLDYVPHFKPREAGWGSLPYEAEVPYGTVQGGTWDQEPPAFSTLLVYQGIKDHYRGGRAWAETAYFTALVEQFEAQGRGHDEATATARQRCQKIERLYEQLKHEGYRSQRSLNGHPLHEVTVTIGRDGTILYNCEGRHRLSVAKVLGVEAIPVLVLVQHEEFDGTIETKRAEQKIQ